MADLIDRAALFTDIDETVVYSGRINTNAEMRGANKIVDRIKAAKAVDAVPVVRCKDCKFMKYVEAYDSWICGTQEDSYIEVSVDFFCAYGERRADATD